MKTGRADLDVLVKVASIPADEPTFMARGQDPHGAGMVRAWVALAKAGGVPPAVLEQAPRQADAMDAWRPKKTPSDDHLTEDQAKNLAYAFGRRAWNEHEEQPDHRIALAEERGWCAAMSLVDALLTALKAAVVCVDRDIALHAPPGLLYAAAEDKTAAAAEHAALVRLRDSIVEPAIARAEALRG